LHPAVIIKKTTMENQSVFIEPLLESAGLYGKTSFDLLKLRSLDKTADIMSTLFSRLLLVIVLSLFALTLNIAGALWLGKLLGENYYGFLIIASFNGIIGIIVFSVHPKIKLRINNSLIRQMFN
jgi:hypothetical protein